MATAHGHRPRHIRLVVGGGLAVFGACTHRYVGRMLADGLAGMRTYATLCAMSTMNISLPDSLKEFVDNQVGSLGYSSSSEYMRELVRRERDRQQLRGLLLEGAASPQSATADSGYFDGLRNRVHAASGQ